MTDHSAEEELGDQYQAAMEEWFASEDAELWDSVTGDGLEDEPEWRSATAQPPPSVTDS
ncbi:hypothetical protein [Glycomyces salinus]|uniref:hypothetical protein n=1 Tax=Glycomyces salinus TaxID=980294 RepID=UPI0018ECDB5A|nr:hypothetical protein [Glycomyces salinus]